MFKISSFSTLALALSFLDAVTAISVNNNGGFSGIASIVGMPIGGKR